MPSTTRTREPRRRWSDPRRPRGRSALPAAAVVLLAVLLPASTACTPPAEVPVAYVAVAGDNHVRLVDLERGETLRRIYTGATPWRLARSPADGRLWVQHWYAGTTAVVDPDRDHAVVGSIPYRGPGAFLAGGDWLTADWPGRSLARVDPGSLEVRGEHDSEVKEIYDLAPFAGGAGDGPERLLLAQHDPMARGGRAPRYGYVLTYRLPADPSGEAAVPLSHPVGRDPVRVVPVPGQPFFLTADSGTDGIHLVNDLGDRRSLAVCPAPREIAIAPGGHRTAVVCWRGRGAPGSRVVLLDSDYAARPWPRLRPRAEVTLTAGLVAAEWELGGERLWVVDRTGGRLLALDGDDLAVQREVAVGELPADLVLASLSPAEVAAAAAPPPHRRPLLEALARLGEAGGPFRDLSWVETLSWQEAVPSEGGDDVEGDGDGEGGDDQGEGQGDPPARVERSRRLDVALRSPGDLRTETAQGAVRLAAGGDAVSLDPAGRFWTTPRQDLLGVVLALPALDPPVALRRLAGDVPGGDVLVNGIAVDRVGEVEEGGARFLVVGAGPTGERVSQLWIDLETALPVQLVERFPVFSAGAGHGGGTPPAVAETLLDDWRPVGEGDGETPPPLLPRRLRRVLEGSWVQHARLDEVTADADLPAAAFDPARLAGVDPAPELFRPAAAPAGDAGPGVGGEGDGAAGPGTAVPVDLPPEPVGGPLAPHPPYPSNPPSSGTYLAWAADPGVHRVPVPLPLQVHHLLDGGVAAQYDCPRGCPEWEAALAGVAARHGELLVAPYPWLGSPGDPSPRLALTAWGRLQVLEAPDPAAVERSVEAFLEAWAGGDHHGDGVAGHP